MHIYIYIYVYISIDLSLSTYIYIYIYSRRKAASRDGKWSGSPRPQGRGTMAGGPAVLIITYKLNDHHKDHNSNNKRK